MRIIWIGGLRIPLDFNPSMNMFASKRHLQGGGGVTGRCDGDVGGWGDTVRFETRPRGIMRLLCFLLGHKYKYITSPSYHSRFRCGRCGKETEGWS